MSSSSNDTAADEPRWHSLLSRGSITTHIGRLYTLSAVVLLAIVVGLLQWVEMQSLRGRDTYFLIDRVQQLRMILKQHPNDPTFLEQEVRFEGGSYAAELHYLIYSRVLDERGQVLVETPGAENLPPALFPTPTPDDGVPQQAVLKRAADGRSYLLATAWSEAEAAGQPRRLIQVALDNADEKNFMSLYQGGSMFLVILGIVVAARVGALVARSGMRPLDDITRVAEQITASQLRQRLQPERWPSELAALAQAFDGMLGRLDDSHTRLAQFSADIAHELRTPIHALMGQAEAALIKERTPAEYRRLLQSNLEVYQRLTRMINELLFLARAEDPKTLIERRWLDARAELEAVRDFHEALAEDRGVSLICTGQAQLYADPHLFRRAVTNLLSNGLRHTPRGGQIVLSLERGGDDDVLVRVTDSGCGIRGEDLPYVFERLYSPDRSSARSTEGTGLGLAIVKSIAELHGGSAAVDSGPGRGTTVILRFPAPMPAKAA